jgi:hypothetical protein
MTRSGQNRPLKYGEKDRREFIVMDSEVEVRAQNDGNGNPIYFGRAKAGVADSDEMWQIRFITYDGNQGITSIEWPENDLGNPSTEYEFSWTDRLTYTYN